MRIFVAGSLINRRISEAVAHALERPGHEVLLPQRFCPADSPHETYPQRVRECCLEAMHESDIGLFMLDCYGRDSAWEAGWFSNAGRPMVGLAMASSRILQDWMVKGGLASVATTSDQLGRAFCRDEFFRNGRALRIGDLDELAGALESVASGWAIPAAATEQVHANRPRVYLSGSLVNRPINKAIAHALERAGHDVLLPQTFCPPETPHETYPVRIWERCITAMHQSDFGLFTLDCYGRDSAWEAGWYEKAGKAMVGFAMTSGRILEDLMVKGGLASIVTTSDELEQAFGNDEILRKRGILRIRDLDELAGALESVVADQTIATAPAEPSHADGETGHDKRENIE